MRIPIIAGNWKMNMLTADAVSFVDLVAPQLKDTDVKAVIFAPYTLLPAMVEKAKGTKLGIGAENMHFEDHGAYTGEVSGAMLKDIGVDYVILGHSERRQYFGETDETVNLKLKKAHEVALKPIVCVGENLKQKEEKQTKTVIKNQVIKAFEGLTVEQAMETIVAYEPIWAIGTGKTATAEEAEEVIGFIRCILEDFYGEEAAEEIILQYGGSVKPSNVTELMNQTNIDGVLVGGASLKPGDFLALVDF